MNAAETIAHYHLDEAHLDKLIELTAEVFPHPYHLTELRAAADNETLMAFDFGLRDNDCRCPISTVFESNEAMAAYQVGRPNPSYDFQQLLVLIVSNAIERTGRDIDQEVPITCALMGLVLDRLEGIV
jgi:hypothetical protein